MLLYILIRLVDLYSLVIFVWAILSWFPASRSGRGVLAQVYRALGKVVDPYVGLFRRFIHPMGGIDWSPFIAMIVLQLVMRLLIYLF
ncbi:MAG: YggT family protein [Coriobacteriales bacterium]|jgi:YggT family protein|nr:YggT family protein [Coriobacteriales bacterium]